MNLSYCIMLSIMIAMNLLNIFTYLNKFIIKNNIKFKIYDTYDMYNLFNSNIDYNNTNSNITISYSIISNILDDNNINLTNNKNIYLLNNIF